MDNLDATIAHVVSAGLCLQCGTCLSACPLTCIDLQRDDMLNFVPVIDIECCDRCGICVEVCPGIGLDFKGFGNPRAENSSVRQNQDTGFYLRSFLGHAVDDAMRSASSSGGVVSGVLLHLLESKKIKGALVLSGREGDPFHPVVQIADSPRRLMAGMPSRYHPASINTALRDMDDPGDFAVVGLPCHVHGIKKYLQRCAPGREFALIIGLFCGINLRFDSLHFFAQRAGRSAADLVGVSYRDGIWPGKTVMLFSDGERIPADKNLANHLYAMPRCLFCVDHTNELADISCGDPWLPELANQNEGGWTAVIVRTEKGTATLTAARDHQKINLRDFGIDRIIESQYPMLCFKKKNSWLRMKLARWMGKDIPEYHGNRLRKNFNPFYLLGNIILISTVAAMQKKNFNRRVPKMAAWILGLYKTSILKLLYTDRHLRRAAGKIRGLFASGAGPE